MNDFLNGIFKIWEKLPDEGKTAFTENLTMKEKSAVKIGKQILEYYVDVAQDLKRREEERRLQEEELLKKKKNGKKHRRPNEAQAAAQENENVAPTESTLEAVLKNLPPELVQAVMQGLAKSMQSQERGQADSRVQDTRSQANTVKDEDIIDAEWTEITKDGKRVTRK